MGKEPVTLPVDTSRAWRRHPNVTVKRGPKGMVEPGPGSGDRARGDRRAGDPGPGERCTGTTSMTTFLWSALRSAGVRDPAEVALVVLEQNGTFSILRAGEHIHPAALTGCVAPTSCGPDWTASRRPAPVLSRVRSPSQFRGVRPTVNR